MKRERPPQQEMAFCAIIGLVCCSLPKLQQTSPNQSTGRLPDDYRLRIWIACINCNISRTPSGRVMQKNSNSFSQNLVRSPLDVSSGGSFMPPETRPKVGKKGAAGPRLGTTAKSVRHFAEKRQSSRADRYRHQRHATKLMKGKGRVGQCRHSVVSKKAGVDIVTSKYRDSVGNFAHYEGLQTCGSVWLCPCCGARISETRKGELNQLLAWARAEGYKVKMITLTARHGRDDDLEELLTAMKDAKQRFGRHRTYRRIKLSMVGSVTATEVTCGCKNGWHPHFHMIVITNDEIDLEELRDVWLASLRGAGLDGAGAAFQVQNAEAAGRYITKWGAAEELTMANEKKSKGGRTPAQLLAASCDDEDRQAGMLWAEYAKAFHGRRQLVWSRGLKAMAGIDQVEDQEAAENEKQEEQDEVGRANIPHPVWVGDVVPRNGDRRSEVQDRAEEVGADQAVAELIAGHVPDNSDVIEELWEPRKGGLAALALANVHTGHALPDIKCCSRESLAYVPEKEITMTKKTGICIDALTDEIIGAARFNPGREIEARKWGQEHGLSSSEMDKFVMEVFDRVCGFSAGEPAAKDLSMRTIPEPSTLMTCGVQDVAITA